MKKHRELSTKILSFILTAAMVVMMIPTAVLAEVIPFKTNEMTECHPVHDENCGYIEIMEGVPCAHLNEDGTYSCAPVDAEGAYTCLHDDECGYAQAVEGALCTHECDICKPKESSEPEQKCTCDPIVEDEGEHTSADCPFYEENTDESVLFSSGGNVNVTERDTDEKLSPKLVLQENIYLAKRGSDNNDGSTAQKAVQTFAKAFELVEAGGTIWLSGSGVIEVTDEQTWGSPDKPGVTVKRTSETKGAMFIIKATGKVTLKNITVDGAVRDANGNALPNKSGQIAFSVSGALVMDSGSVVENNFSAANGGAISVYGTLSLRGDAVIRGNKTVPGKGGGAFGAAGSTITVSDTASITGNSGGSGGGIYSVGTVIINGGTISNNTATANGGGVDSSDTGSLLVSGGTISNNNTGEYGGGIYCGGISSKISGAVIENNSAEKSGGGIYYSNVSVDTDAFSIGDCTLNENTAVGNGLPAWGKGNNVYVYDNHLLVEGDALSGGGVFLCLDNTESKLIFKNAPKGVSLEGIKPGDSKPIAGTVVAEGNGYTLTQDDLSKFTYDGEGYTFKLDTDKNQIKMCELYTVTFDGGGGDGSYPAQKIPSGSKAVKPEDPTKTGYTFDGWYAGSTLFDFESTPITANITLKAKWTDKTAPLAEISLGENRWNKFLNTVTFGLFFKDTQTVTVSASDAGSGVKSVEYYTANAKVEDISAIKWTSYTDDFSLQPNNKYVIYARVTDNAGNITVINSDGLVFDDIAPIITGADNDGVYCISRELTIAENYLDTVTVDGKKATVTDGKITVSSKATAQTIVATDKSGNSATITITVNASHTPNDDDGDCTTAIHCSVCNEITTADKAHDFTGAWETDGSYHWHKCKNTDCTQIKDKTAHTPNADDGDCTTAIHCSACDYITTAEKTQHALSGWKSDGTNHWKECENADCTHKEQEAAHTWNIGEITTPATITQEGVKTYTCTVCSQTKTEVIPKLPSNSTIVDNSTGTKVEYEDGSTFDSSIVLSVTSKPQAEMDKFKDSVSKTAPGLTLGGLYDVKLLKDGVEVQPNGKIKVSIPLTDAMKSMTNLQIVYIDDNGNITIIPSEVKDGMITFITDHFSNYGVIGKVKSTDPGDNNSNNGNTNSPQTGDNSPMLLFVLLMCASGTVLVVLGKKKKVFKHLKK